MAMRKRTSAPETNPLEWTGLNVERRRYEPGVTIFRQGEPCTTILYIEQGSVRLSVVSHAGKEAVIAVLDGGDFFGEGCLAGQSVRTATATAMSECSVLRIRRHEVARKLHAEESFADSFVSHILKRNIRMEEDSLTNSSTPPRSAWLERSCCSRNTGRVTARSARCPKSHKRFSQRWLEPPASASTFS